MYQMYTLLLIFFIILCKSYVLSYCPHHICGYNFTLCFEIIYVIFTGVIVGIGWFLFRLITNYLH